MPKTTLPTDGSIIEVPHAPRGSWINYPWRLGLPGYRASTTWKVEGQLGRDDGPGPHTCGTCGENIATGRVAISEGSSPYRPWHHLGCLDAEEVYRLTQGMPRDPRKVPGRPHVRLTKALEAPRFRVELTEMAAHAVLAEGDTLGFRAKADTDALTGLAREALERAAGRKVA